MTRNEKPRPNKGRGFRISVTWWGFAWAKMNPGTSPRLSPLGAGHLVPTVRFHIGITSFPT